MSEVTETTSTVPVQHEQPHLRRRGLIAGAAALAATVLARSSMNATAADGGNLVIGTAGDANNVASTTTTLAKSGATGPALRVKNASYQGVTDGTADGIQGFSLGSGNTGVFGRNDDLNAVGVYGVASNGTGVAGQSTGGSALVGSSSSGAGGYLTSISGYGSYNSSTSSTAVYGVSSTGIGIYGVHSDASGSGVPYGVVGAVTGVGIGVYGVVATPGAVAFAGGAGVNGAIAAQFSGPVNILHTGGTTNGNLYIQGNYTAGGTKSAAVPHPDGSHRLLYCVESPEAWFEDFGEGTVTGGKAEITLDPDFAATVDTAKLHVFVTETGGHSGLHIAAKSATGFTVHASDAVAKAAGVNVGSVASTFSYRVVAKRKDVAAPRLAKFEIPKEFKATPPKIETAQTPPGFDRRSDGQASKKH